MKTYFNPQTKQTAVRNPKIDNGYAVYDENNTLLDIVSIREIEVNFDWVRVKDKENYINCKSN
jgi:hypothetical protein